MAGRKEKYTNAHLPPGSQDNGAWRRIFVPTFLQYLASRKTDGDAWAASDDDGVSIQQKVWNFVYGGKVPHIITVQGPVFTLVSVLIFVTSILITPLFRSINVFVSGAADFPPLPSSLSMHSLTTTITTPMTPVNYSQPLLWNLMHFSTVIFPPTRMAR